jgi:hypothetical protein
MPMSFPLTKRACRRVCRLLLATLIPASFAPATASAESVAMVYVIGDQKLQIMQSDITEARVGRLRDVGDPFGRGALRICFTPAVHARILDFVTRNLRQYDRFKLVIDCKVVVDLRITAFDGEGGCNFIYSEEIGELMQLEQSIQSGMTNSTCEAYIS